MIAGQAAKSLLNGRLLLLGFQRLMRRRRQIAQTKHISVAMPVIVHRNGRHAMTSLPPAQAVEDFRNSDAENPCLQRGIPTKRSDVAKHLQENILYDIGRLAT